MADLDDLEASAAWAALPKSARKVFKAVADTIAASGGDTAVVSFSDLIFDHHCGQPAQSLRLLRYLQLLAVAPDRHLGGRYSRRRLAHD